MPTPDTLRKTILFADIAGSTRLYDLLGDVRARALIAECLEKLKTAAQNHQGQVIKTIGDEVMCTFETPDCAAAAAISMQEKVSADPVLAAQLVQLRIGLHHGPVLAENGDVFGDAVNIAARMVDQAKAGQIITTRLTLEMMSEGQRAAARLVDQARIRGKQDLIGICELSWGRPEERTIMSSGNGQPLNLKSGPNAVMILSFQKQRIAVNQKQPVVTLGRDESNRLVVNDPKVSRLHARIELRRDKFVLVDQSTNGTYIHPQEGDVVLLRRDEIPLQGQGVIGLGQTLKPDAALAIKYQRL